MMNASAMLCTFNLLILAQGFKCIVRLLCYRYAWKDHCILLCPLYVSPCFIVLGRTLLYQYGRVKFEDLLIINVS